MVKQQENSSGFGGYLPAVSIIFLFSFWGFFFLFSLLFLSKISLCFFFRSALAGLHSYRHNDGLYLERKLTELDFK
ncbi:hypothetical protein DD829_14005 [Chryseobacterium sp. HMWF035]|nr:hypothetical protein DBR25_05480 [Chryseobacterium sp. HMWF001]PVV55580.1 hypothetical protein DD829_14005 [Chryseobacterium sp. HMWF035]